jgi:hypothetical protein
MASRDISAECIGSASWTFGDLTTTSMLASRSRWSCTSSMGSGATGTCASVVVSPSTASSGAVSPTGTASGFTVPSTCVSVIARYAASLLGGYNYLRQTALLSCTYLPLWCLLATWLLRPVPRSQPEEGGGFLHSGRWIFFSSCRVWFFSFPGQIN